MPLSNFPVVRSSDPEVVRDRLFRACGATSLDVGKGEKGFTGISNHLQLGGLGLSYCDYTSDVSLGLGEASYIRQLFNIEGTGRFTAGNRSGEITPGSWTPILPAATPLKLEFKADYRQIVLRIEVDALRRNLDALLGHDGGPKLVFDETPARQPAMEALRRRLFHFALDYNERGQFFSDLAAAEVERMVIMKFLMCHRHNFTHLLLREPLPTSRSTVRTVEEFVEANWNKPIDIEAMVAVANVSARSLFRQFKRDRGYSPVDFIKRVRLDRAREMLEQHDEDASVVQIALKCGFQNPGHFARYFRLAFGELPSVILKRSRSRRS
jgi:AraC-like DNA-binding protein